MWPLKLKGRSFDLREGMGWRAETSQEKDNKWGHDADKAGEAGRASSAPSNTIAPSHVGFFSFKFTLIKINF